MGIPSIFSYISLMYSTIPYPKISKHISKLKSMLTCYLRSNSKNTRHNTTWYLITQHDMTTGHDFANTIIFVSISQDHKYHTRFIKVLNWTSLQVQQQWPTPLRPPPSPSGHADPVTALSPRCHKNVMLLVMYVVITIDKLQVQIHTIQIINF